MVACYWGDPRHKLSLLPSQLCGPFESSRLDMEAWWWCGTRHNRLCDVFVELCWQACIGVLVEVGNGYRLEGMTSWCPCYKQDAGEACWDAGEACWRSLLEKPAGMLEKPAGMLEKPAGMLEKPAGMLEKPAGMLEKPAGMQLLWTMDNCAAWLNKRQAMIEPTWPKALLSRSTQNIPDWIIIDSMCFFLKRDLAHVFSIFQYSRSLKCQLLTHWESEYLSLSTKALI